MKLQEAIDLNGKAEGLRIEGGLTYPDELLESWRWLHGCPYVSMDKTDFGTWFKHIRVFYEPYNAHLYLENVMPKPGEEGLVQVTFSFKNPGEHLKYCHIPYWADTKDIIRSKILDVNYKEPNCPALDILNCNPWPVHAVDDKNRWARWTKDDIYYRINKIFFI